jgi:hypothetical protein
MTWNQREFRIRKLAVDDVQIGAANGTCGHLDENLARLKSGDGTILKL